MFSIINIFLVPTGAAAFAGAVTHTISVSVIVFELTGQMTHIIPVIISVLIANAISQTLDLNIYDSIIQIKKLPFLPPILTTSSSAHNIYVEDIMVRDVVCIWRNCTYRDVKAVLAGHPTLQSFPLVDNGLNMILLGSIQRDQLALLSHSRLSRERRLQEVRRRYSIQDALALTPPDPTENGSQSTKMSTVHYESLPRDINARKMSRFEVTPVGFGKQTMSAGGGIESGSGVKSPKSILKQTISFTYSPNATVTALSAQGKL